MVKCGPNYSEIKKRIHKQNMKIILKELTSIFGIFKYPTCEGVGIAPIQDKQIPHSSKKKGPILFFNHPVFELSWVPFHGDCDII